MKTKRNVLLMVGLPGSGKTTFAKKYECRLSYKVIHLDDLKDEWLNRNKSQVEILKSEITHHIAESLVIDGLFLTNKDVLEVLQMIVDYFSLISVEIHYWEEDRDTCLKNDGGRRSKSSNLTIQNALFEKIDINMLKEALKNDNIKLINHTVKLKDDWYLYFKQHSDIKQSNGKLCSSTWCTGGSVGNCFDSSLFSISADEPIEFTELDNLLEEICPNLTFLVYKKILKECVSTEKSSESDYYGGHTNYLNWVCDLKKLYEILNELEYIK